MSAVFDDYPESFPAHSRPSAGRYRLRRDCFACSDDASGARGLPVMAALPAEGLLLLAGRPDALRDEFASACRPVYALGDDPTAAIPTGRVFVQAAAGTDLAAVLAPLGFEIESVPPYAPHAAWIVAGDGSIATALMELDALIAAEGIESAEPQMLRPMGFRGGR